MTVTSDRPARSPQSASPIPADAPPPAARDRLAGSLPYLRRYARALSGTQSSGDAFVRMMLEAALSDPEMRAQVNASAVGLYKAFTAVWNTANLDAVDGRETPEPNPSQLSRVPSQRRQALLLNQLEDFSIADTADILDLSEEETQLLVDAAMADLAGDSVADVLIIEDEPLISSHLESIVAEAGHRIIANATTADEARAAFEQHRPTLVLADVQLADGSSGISAVEDILQIGAVPVIFITAFPEKLLTGERPEPAFLITKPFREETVRTAISQALFFGSDFKA